MTLPAQARSSAEVDVAAAAEVLARRTGRGPFDVALVLGSGLGPFVDEVSEPRSVPFAAVPGFPETGVAGHAGRWVAGWVAGRRVLVQAGRYHRYEGWDAAVVTAPVRVAAALGVPTVLLTNAAGSLRADFPPGRFVALRAHLDLLDGTLPDAGSGSAVAYDPALRDLARRSAESIAEPLAEGVYAAVPGPSYETPAEIRLLADLGADLVGMSTAPEAEAAHGAGMRCLAVSLVTNWASGMAPIAPDHADVVDQGRRAAGRFARLLTAIVRDLPPA